VIERAIAVRDRALLTLLDTDLDGLETVPEDAAQGYDSELKAGDAPIVRYVNKLLVDAVDNGASDIHFEPYEKHCRIRFRQDSLLQEISNPPVAVAAHLVARLKVISRMNITEHRVPQVRAHQVQDRPRPGDRFRVNPAILCMGRRSP